MAEKTAEERLQELVQENPTFGRIRLTKQLQTEGYRVGTFWVQIRLHGLRAGMPLPAERPLAEVLEAREEHRLKREVRTLKAQLDQERIENDLERQVLGILTELKGSQLAPPQWLATTSTHKNGAIPSAFLSDTHFDEQVLPTEINGVNAYNREIAELRLRKFFQNVVELGRDYFCSVRMEGLVLPLGGDMASGDIHEELAQTNLASVIDTCLHWSERLAAGVRCLLTFYPSVFVPCVVGNHGRNSKKPRAKRKVRNNYDYLIYCLLAREFKGDERVSFQIAEGSDAHYRIYNTRYCLSHGDQFRGGSGISGALSPLMIGDARKRKRSGALNSSYDYLLLAHWHQRMAFKGIIVNGSLKGYDEFAYGSNFDFEPPQQSFWLTDPVKGKTLEAPVHVLSEAEGWQRPDSPQPGWLREEEV